MKRKWTVIGFGALAAAFAGQVQANPMPIGFAPAPLVDRGMLVVQDTTLPTLAPSSLRRMTFYSDKTIIALFDLANEDLAAGQDGGKISSETTDALRAAIVRLIDAGSKADLDVDQVALFFAQEVAVRFSGPLPLILQDANGNLDAKALFQGVANSDIKTNAPAGDADYLSALNAEVESLTSTADEVVTEEVAEVEPRDPLMQAIINRANVTNGGRTIVVEQGDTLASYAQAFYGDTLLYRTIFNANTAKLSNPNTLVIGQVLTIPEG